jgi:hypothetical protein
MRRLVRETLVLSSGFAGFWVVWLIYFVLIALFFESAEAACSGSSPNLTATTWADIGACYRAATNGDTLTVTPNTYNVSKQTTLNGRKAVTIEICGSSMNITDNTPVAGALFDITEPSNALSNGAGITFDGCGTGTITMGTVHSQPGGSFWSVLAAVRSRSSRALSSINFPTAPACISSSIAVWSRATCSMAPSSPPTEPTSRRL